MHEPICKTVQQLAAWRELSERIEAEPQDGFSAEGDFNPKIYARQRKFVDGMRAGRLASFKAINRHNSKDE
jgi:hypothetical protein